MPTHPCPCCEYDTPRKLDAPSEYARVDYYRCGQCGHVWITDKDDSTRIQHITELPPLKPRRETDH